MNDYPTTRFGALWPATVFTIDSAGTILHMKLQDSYPTVGNAVVLSTGTISTIDEDAYVRVRPHTILIDGENAIL